MFYLLAIAIVIILIADGIPLVKKRQWAEFLTLIVLVSVSVTLLILKYINIPTPLKILNNMLKGLGIKLFGPLKY